MNIQQKHAAASAKLDELQKQLDNLFNDCQTECQGMSTAEANKVYTAKYKAKCPWKWVNKSIDIYHTFVEQ